ncbi:MAG: hypothetical protein ABSH12_00705 [Endomicrobiales bacterium]
MTTTKKSSCCCSKHGHKKTDCQPFTIKLLTCSACGLMYNKIFKNCPQCSWDTDNKTPKKVKEDR